MSTLAAYVVACQQLFTTAPEAHKYLVEDARQPQGWVAFENETGHRFLIQRTKGKLPMCHTSLPIGPGQSHASSGTVLPDKHNGAICAQFMFNAAFIKRVVLPLMADSSLPPPQTHRGARAGGPKISLSPSEILAMVTAKPLPAASPVPAQTPSVPVTDLVEDARQPQS